MGFPSREISISCAPLTLQLDANCICRWSGHDKVIQLNCALSARLENRSFATNLPNLSGISPISSLSKSLLNPTAGGISFPPRSKSATNRPAAPFRSCYWAKNYRLGDLNSEPAVSFRSVPIGSKRQPRSFALAPPLVSLKRTLILLFASGRIGPTRPQLHDFRCWSCISKAS